MLTLCQALRGGGGRRSGEEKRGGGRGGKERGGGRGKSEWELTGIEGKYCVNCFTRTVPFNPTKLGNRYEIPSDKLSNVPKATQFITGKEGIKPGS